MWIINYGATSHLKYDQILFKSKIKPRNPMPVYLPDGSINNVHNVGNVKLNSKLELIDTLHIPAFKNNHISVSKLANTLNITVHFYPKYCVLQDLLTKDVIAYGRIHDGLYRLDIDINPTKVPAAFSLPINQACACHNCNKTCSVSYL